MNKPLSAVKAAKSVIAPVKKSIKKDEGIDPTKKDIPRSIVVTHGKSNRLLKELVDNLRKVMSPHTALKLKERKKASMKDYISVAGSLKVSHILSVTQATKTPTLKIARMPQGPTLSFRLQSYALNNQIRSSQKNKLDYMLALKHAPLVVLNNFDDTSKRHMKIASLTFQAMFPAVNVRTVKLIDCKRVLLIHLDQENDVIEFRHFLVNTESRGASREVKRLVTSQIPNLSHVNDISDVILGDVAIGYATSDSEFEDESACVNIDLRKKLKKPVVGATSQSAVKLTEIGPRMTLQVYKVQDGVFDGEVQYHAHESRTKEEILTLRGKHVIKKEEKETRRNEQEENIKRKRLVEDERKEKKKAKKERRLANQQKNLEEVPESSEEDDDEDDDEDGSQE